MEPSAELVEIVRRCYRALSDGDEDTMRDLFAESEAVVVVGVERQEWFSGFREWSEGLSRIAADIRGGVWEERCLRAWSLGNAGWAIDRPVIRRRDGASTEFRLSAVFCLQRAYWRIVHMHVSIGLERGPSGAWEQPTTISDLLRAVTEDRPDLSAIASLDGTVSVLFSDIEESTARAEAAGDVRWLDELKQHEALVRERAAAHRGAVVKSLGDGFMLAFPSARLAVECALGIQDEIGGEPPVRMGVHTGEALRHESDFFGHTVTLAARVAGAAAGGEVLVSEIVRGLVAGLGIFDFGEPRSVLLKGIAGEHRVYSVTARGA